MIKVIGIDPGLSGTGIGVIKGDKNNITGYSFGSISTNSKDSIACRLHTIYSKTLAFLKEQKPDFLVVEDIYSLEKYPNSGIILGKVAGVLLVAAYEVNLCVKEISVKQAKKIISGSGNADKFQIEKTVRNLLNHDSPIRPFHASDALALALTGYYREKDHI